MQLAGTQGRACLSPSRILSDLAKPAVRESGGDFFRYTDAKKILPLARCAWTGHVWPDKIFQAMGALRFVSVPILPRPSPWLRTDPARHDLSRPAGTKWSSFFTMDVISHHSPNKACEFSRYCCNCNISFLSVISQSVVPASEPDICFVSVRDYIYWIPFLPCGKTLGFLTNPSLADTSCCLNQQSPQM